MPCVVILNSNFNRQILRRRPLLFRHSNPRWNLNCEEGKGMTSVKLSAKWQLDAALLSRPVDLTSLVSLSRSHPEKFLEDNTIHRYVIHMKILSIFSVNCEVLTHDLI